MAVGIAAKLMLVPTNHNDRGGRTGGRMNGEAHMFKALVPDDSSGSGGAPAHGRAA